MTTTSSIESPTGQRQEEWKKYSRYSCEVDPEQNDRATQIQFCSCSRPQMRAFHCSFWGFFFGCFIWFAINPLLPEIRNSLDLETSVIWTSSVFCVAGTLFMRLFLGPMCDKFGPRALFAVVLCCASIPTACIGMLETGTGLVIVRFFIGFAGGVFVLCQGWTNAMFAEQTSGTAISIVAGWGNLASGLTQLVVGSALFPLFKTFFDGDAEKAWRTVTVVPAAIAIAGGITIFFVSDDTPKGNFRELKNHDAMAEVSAIGSFQHGIQNLNAWFLFMQNACATGVELTMHNASALYFQDQFNLTTEASAAIASILGWMGLSCGFGGYLSDTASARMGLRGRLWIQTIVLACLGSLILIFANTKTLSEAIVAMVFLSLFVQVSEGTTYSLVPAIAPSSSGSVSGIVSAGGNVGAIAFGLVFRQLDYGPAFTAMGVCTLVSSLLSFCIAATSHSSVCGSRKVDSAEEARVKSACESPSASSLVIRPREKSGTPPSGFSTNTHRVEISRSALLANVQFFRRLCRKRYLMAVVKSNAYGHGLETVVPILSGRIDWFGVNSVEEAERVRALDSDTPVLVMGMNAWDVNANEVLPSGLTFAVSSIRAIETLQQKAPGVPFHLVIDTGMSRLGGQGAELDRTLDFLADHPRMPWTGVMTHFANTSVEDGTCPASRLSQLSRFEIIREKAETSAGAHRPLLAHAAASVGALVLQESLLHNACCMIRVGIGLYGLWPSHLVQQSVTLLEADDQGLRPVMQWFSRIVHCHQIPAGSCVGYGGTVQVDRKTLIAVVPVGYYEGYDPALSNRSDVLVRGQRCRLLGRVSMNMITVDITDVTGACEGDEVVLMGHGHNNVGKEEIGADELAEISGTTSYEVVTRINEKLPRTVVVD